MLYCSQCFPPELIIYIADARNKSERPNNARHCHTGPTPASNVGLSTSLGPQSELLGTASLGKHWDCCIPVLVECVFPKCVFSI